MTLWQSIRSSKGRCQVMSWGRPVCGVSKAVPCNNLQTIVSVSARSCWHSNYVLGEGPSRRKERKLWKLSRHVSGKKHTNIFWIKGASWQPNIASGDESQFSALMARFISDKFLHSTTNTFLVGWCKKLNSFWQFRTDIDCVYRSSLNSADSNSISLIYKI